MTYDEHYAECIKNGCSPMLADMFASGQTPALMTDSVFMAGHDSGSQFAGQEDVGDYLKSVAENHGQNVKGKVYKGALARFPGDPEAWVSGRGDVERVARKRGYNVTGSVNVKSSETPTAPKKRAGKLKVRFRAAGLPVGE